MTGRIALFLDADVRWGGAHAQELSTLELFRDHVGERILVVCGSQRTHQSLSAAGIPSEYLPRSTWSMRRHFLPGAGPAWQWLCSRIGWRGQLDRWCGRRGIVLAVFLGQLTRALELEDTPYISTVWDLAHRDLPEFREFAQEGRYWARERLFADSLPRATAVLVDSPETARKIQGWYGVEVSRTVVLPLMPPNRTQATLQAGPEIPGEIAGGEPFVFYPAHYWPHKNHALLIRAMAELARRGVAIRLLGCGGDNGQRQRLLDLARQLGIAGRIHLLDFISDSALTWCYAKATAMAMPTWLGPTNLPPHEAFAAGCPVIYSAHLAAGYSGLVWEVDIGSATATMQIADAVQEILSGSEAVRNRIARAGDFQQAWRAVDRWSPIQRALHRFDALSDAIDPGRSGSDRPR